MIFKIFKVFRKEDELYEISSVSLGLGLIDVWASYWFCYQEEPYVFSAHGLMLQREVASDQEIGAFFRRKKKKKAELGKVPGHIAL